MGNELKNTVLEKRVSLPKPDVDNITVLSESLPNEPVLPWHRFDSPWLEQEQGEAKTAADAESKADTEAAKRAAEDTTEQLTLELPESEGPSDIASVDELEPVSERGADSSCGDAPDKLEEI